MTHTVTVHHEARTINGWVPCTIRRTFYRRKKEGQPRVIKHFYAQLLPAMNVVKRLPKDIREVEHA